MTKIIVLNGNGISVSDLEEDEGQEESEGPCTCAFCTAMKATGLTDHKEMYFVAELVKIRRDEEQLRAGAPENGVDPDNPVLQDAVTQVLKSLKENPNRTLH